MPGESTAQQLESFQNPPVPSFQTLPDSVQVPVLTTQDVNGPHGSIDNGGAIDRCVWALSAAQEQAQLGAYMRAMKPLNDESIARTGIPFAVPTVMGGFTNATLAILSAFMGGYHGYKRSRGKALTTAGYAAAGAIFPLITLGVAAVQGYAKPRR